MIHSHMAILGLRLATCWMEQSRERERERERDLELRQASFKFP
jgi:hypothetical protein